MINNKNTKCFLVLLLTLLLIGLPITANAYGSHLSDSSKELNNIEPIETGFSFYNDERSSTFSVSVPYKASEKVLFSGYPQQQYNQRSWIAGLILDFIITIVIHPLPIIAYRFLFNDAPVSPEKAKSIVIIDTIIVVIIWFVIMQIRKTGYVSFIAIYIWARICYKLLIKGYKDDTHSSEANSKGHTQSREYNGWKMERLAARVPDLKLAEENAISVNSTDETIEYSKIVDSARDIKSTTAKYVNGDQESIEFKDSKTNEQVLTYPLRDTHIVKDDNYSSSYINNNSIKKDTIDICDSIANADNSNRKSRIAFCRYCGKRIERDALFCSNCGKKIV